MQYEWGEPITGARQQASLPVPKLFFQIMLEAWNIGREEEVYLTEKLLEKAWFWEVCGLLWGDDWQINVVISTVRAFS